MKIILTCLVSLSVTAAMANSKTESKVSSKSISKEEVVDNPTLKTLSGSLKKFSLYSSYTYRGGSLDKPTSAERPNIQRAQETAGLSNMSGNLGLKYRLSKNDNLSIQIGLYSTTPFHSTLETDNEKNKKDFDQNHQNLDADDPTLSYFKTYYLGDIQNISFLKLQYVTRGIYRDYGLRSGFSYSHAAAYKINKAAYIAGSLTYERYNFDRSSTTYNGYEISLLPYQTEEKLRGNLSSEFYIKRNISLRLITDIFSKFSMKENSSVEDRTLQQTLAMTYFYNRDISIAPSIRFIASDLKSKRTNLGFTFNANI